MEIDAHTEFCGVIGNPVEHSLSPAIHNAAFQRLGMNCVYLAWKVERISDAIQGLRALGNFRGASVTIPHKVSAMPFLDRIEPTAANIGAINTIVNENGTLTGYNTDATGAFRALNQAGVELKERSIVILGSGGAARAIAFALGTFANAAQMTLLGIDDGERRKLAADLRANTAVHVHDAHLSEDALRKTLGQSHVLIHCTPIGMFPNTEASCVPAATLHPELAVMDIVYNPRETRLLKDARDKGCRIVRGLEMFLNQAVAQFELWTHREAPADVMRSVLESRFQ